MNRGGYRRRLSAREVERKSIPCKRCKKHRWECRGSFFSKGYCGRCYGILLQYKQDLMLAKIHDLNVQLKAEIVEKRRDMVRKRMPWIKFN